MGSLDIDASHPGVDINSPHLDEMLNQYPVNSMVDTMLKLNPLASMQNDISP